MDKSWMRAKNRFSPEYKQGVQEFMEFARYRADSGNRIRCPCQKCKNMIYKTLDKVEDDLFIVGIDQGYTWWIHHGEEFHQRVEAIEVLADPIVPNDKDKDVDEMQDIIGDARSGHSRTGSTPSTHDATETTSTSHAASQPSKPSVEHTPCTTSSLTSRRGRGPTRGLVLERLTREGRVTVEFPQDCLRPVGDNASLFTSEVGVLCRSLIPATTPRWADVTDGVRQLIRQRLQDKFILDLSVPYISHAIDDMIRERFKEYRGELHRRYKRCKTHDEAVLSAPPHVTIDDWRILCKRFSSDAFQKRSRINSANRKKLQVNHIAGSKSFVRHRYDMRDSVTGQEPGPIDLYRRTHCRQATGSWVHPKANENRAAMDTIRSQPTLDCSQRSEADIPSEMLGTRSAYVRGRGHGAKLMTPARAASSRSVAEESALRRADIAKREVQQLQVIVDEIKEQLERQREEEEQRRREEERRQEVHERRIEEMRVEHERRMQEMFQAIATRFATNAPPPPPSSS